MRKFLFIVFLLLTLLFADFYQNRNNYGLIGRSTFPMTENVHRNEDQLIDFIESTMSTNSIPGISIAVVKEGSLVWNKNFGYANINDSILVDDDIMFSLASVSKTVTATALMQLWEQGYFLLDDSINDYLPFNVVHPDHPFTSITFKMLLTHTSGIKDRWSVMTYYDGDPLLELGYFLEEYLVQGGEFYSQNACYTNFEPGTSSDYSNIGAALIGFLVESISGQPFNEYCNENIFGPLEMENAAWFLSELDIEQVAVPYRLIGGNGDNCYEIGCGIYDNSNPCFCDYECIEFGDCCSDFEEVCGEDGSGNPDGTIVLSEYNHYGYADYPSGQLRCSAKDLSKFMSAYMNGGAYNGVHILESETIEYMKEIPFPDIDEKQGLMWYYKNQNNRLLFGHNGGDLGTTTEMFISFSNDIGVIVLSNFSNYFSVVSIESAVFDFAEDTDFIQLGDVNSDGIINVLDVVAVVSIILSSGEYINLADINSDGDIDVLDIVQMVNVILGNA